MSTEPKPVIGKTNHLKRYKIPYSKYKYHTWKEIGDDNNKETNICQQLSIILELRVKIKS